MDPGPAGIPLLEYLFSRLVCIAVPLGYTALLVILVIAGIKYLTSGGETKAVQQAHQTVTWGLLGVLFLAISWLILQLIQNFTGIEVTKFTLASLPGVQSFTGSCWESPPVPPNPTPVPISQQQTPKQAPNVTQKQTTTHPVSPKLSENVCRTLRQSRAPNLNDEDIKVHKIKCNNRNDHLIKGRDDDPNFLATFRYRETPHKIEGFEEVEPELVYIDREGISKDREYRSVFISRSEPAVVEFVEENLPPEWKIFYTRYIDGIPPVLRFSPYWLRFPKRAGTTDYQDTAYGGTIRDYAFAFQHIFYQLQILSKMETDMSSIAYQWYFPHLKEFSQYNNQVHLLMYDCPDADYYYFFGLCDRSLGLNYVCKK